MDIDGNAPLEIEKHLPKYLNHYFQVLCQSSGGVMVQDESLEPKAFVESLAMLHPELVKWMRWRQAILQPHPQQNEFSLCFVVDAFGLKLLGVQTSCIFLGFVGLTLLSHPWWGPSSLIKHKSWITGSITCTSWGCRPQVTLNLFTKNHPEKVKFGGIPHPLTVK